MRGGLRATSRRHRCHRRRRRRRLLRLLRKPVRTRRSVRGRRGASCLRGTVGDTGSSWAAAAAAEATRADGPVTSVGNADGVSKPGRYVIPVRGWRRQMTAGRASRRSRRYCRRRVDLARTPPRGSAVVRRRRRRFIVGGTFDRGCGMVKRWRGFCGCYRRRRVGSSSSSRPVVGRRRSHGRGRSPRRRG